MLVTSKGFMWPPHQGCPTKLPPAGNLSRLLHVTYKAAHPAHTRWFKDAMKIRIIHFRRITSIPPQLTLRPHQNPLLFFACQWREHTKKTQTVLFHSLFTIMWAIILFSGTDTMLIRTPWWHRRSCFCSYGDTTVHRGLPSFRIRGNHKKILFGITICALMSHNMLDS